MLRKLDEMGGEKMRAVVLISDEGRAGTAIHGFESDNEAVALLFAHLMAIFEANGQKLMIMPIGQG
ncbi:MAG TPA: hypothetical protein VLI07_18645 [Candidatus Binatus sp.]|nr:hypothetical protein [Candidatus Binatus sp.]